MSVSITRREMLCTSSLVVLAGCGGEKNGTTQSEADGSPVEGGTAGAGTETARIGTASRRPQKPWDPSVGTATIKGVVRFKGKPPERKVLDMSSDSVCCRLNRKPILAEAVLVNADGMLKNVLVWVRRGLEEWEFPPPGDPVLLDQVGCMFRPHVLGVRVDQGVTIRNSDPVFNNPHVFPKRNTGFNFTQAQQGMEETRSFPLPETMILVKCDIHPWESAYIHVIPHPYFVVTADDGFFELPNLPPGDFVLQAEHESLGKKTAKVTVAKGESATIEFSFEERA